MASTLIPEIGDLIEIFRGSYQHWAVHVGDGYVVHLAEAPGADANNIVTPILTQKALVKKEELWKVVGSDKWKINNILDEKYKSFPAHAIVSEACSLVGEEHPYSLTSSNCEHFVTNLRYGKAESRQVQDAVQDLSVTVMMGLVAGAKALVGGSKKENKNTQ